MMCQQIRPCSARQLYVRIIILLRSNAHKYSSTIASLIFLPSQARQVHNENRQPTKLLFTILHQFSIKFSCVPSNIRRVQSFFPVKYNAKLSFPSTPTSKIFPLSKSTRTSLQPNSRAKNPTSTDPPDKKIIQGSRLQPRHVIHAAAIHQGEHTRPLRNAHAYAKRRGARENSSGAKTDSGIKIAARERPAADEMRAAEFDGYRARRQGCFAHKTVMNFSRRGYVGVAQLYNAVIGLLCGFPRGQAWIRVYCFGFQSRW